MKAILTQILDHIKQTLNGHHEQFPLRVHCFGIDGHTGELLLGGEGQPIAHVHFFSKDDAAYRGPVDTIYATPPLSESEISAYRARLIDREGKLYIVKEFIVEDN